MTQINLLPWRESLKKEKQRQFVSLAIGAVALMGVVVLYTHMHISGLIDNQENRNRYLSSEIAKVEVKIKKIFDLESEKTKLLARMEIIQQLQKRRPEIVHLFDELVMSVPDGIYLTKIAQKDQAIVIDGVAQSNARVSTFMRTLERSEWLKEPKLEVIKVNDKMRQRTSNFTLHVKQEFKQESEEE